MLSMSCSGDAEKNHKHANWYCYVFITSNLSQAPVLPNGLTLHLTTWIRLSMPLQRFIILHSLRPSLIVTSSRKPLLLTPHLPNSQPGLGALFWWDTSLCLSSSQGVKVICLFVSPLNRDLWGWNVSSSLYSQHPTSDLGQGWHSANDLELTYLPYTDFQAVQY